MKISKKDCAIVCGYPANDDGTISAILQSRIDKAIELYKNHKINYIIVSGGAIHNQYNEATCMEKYALEKDVDKQAIIVEDRAKSTYHNMMYAKQLMIQYHLVNCYIITNSWHMIKAEYYAKKFALDYQKINANKPKDMSYIKVILYTIYMPFNMFINRLKGFK